MNKVSYPRAMHSRTLCSALSVFDNRNHRLRGETGKKFEVAEGKDKDIDRLRTDLTRKLEEERARVRAQAEMVDVMRADSERQRQTLMAQTQSLQQEVMAVCGTLI